MITEITKIHCGTLLSEEMHRVSLFIVASIAAVFVLSSQYLHLKLDKGCYEILKNVMSVLPL